MEAKVWVLNMTTGINSYQLASLSCICAIINKLQSVTGFNHRQGSHNTGGIVAKKSQLIYNMSKNKRG